MLSFLTGRFLFLLATASVLCESLTAADTTNVASLTALNSPEAWTIEKGEVSDLLAWPDNLGLRLNLTTKGESTILKLKEPQPLPEGTNFLRFTLGAEGVKQAFNVRVLIRDAKGGEYAYQAFSPRMRGRELNFFPSHAPRSSPLRLTLPGLAFPVVAPKNGANIFLLKRPDGKSGDVMPEGPLQVIGLEFVTETPGKGLVYVGDFRAGEISPRTSSLYYVLNDNEGFQETDGLPNLDLGFFGPNSGENFKVVWSVRDHFDGQPFLSGEKEFHFDPKDPAYVLNFNQRIEFPIKEKGVYWIKVRRLWSNKGEKPEQINEWDFRLDILEGAKPIVRKTLAASEPLAGAAVRIAPGRGSFVFAEKEHKALDVEYRPPANATGKLTYRLSAKRPASGQTTEIKEGPIEGREARTISTPLDTLGTGVYSVKAELLEDGKPLDWTERTLEIAGAKETVETQPDEKADWKAFTKGKSLAYIGMNKGSLRDPAERIAKVKSLLDEAGSVSKVVEYETHWADLEPMPGVYDWSEIDAVLDYAKTKGMTVLLYPTFIGGEPDWIPSHFQRRKDGSISGAKGYLYQGGRMNFWHSPELRQRVLDLVSAMAKRYRGNPTVHGYFLLVEHGGDNPARGYFPGYEEETILDYRQHCQKTWTTIEALNQRWGTKLVSWEDISVPTPEVSDRQRLDWYVFRRDRMVGFFLEAVRQIREIDPYKLMLVYTGAVDSLWARDFQKLGCMIADGGAAVPETGGARTMGLAEIGLGRRTEEVSVGAWSGDFFTQLDATLFNLTLGGGGNTNTKMFFVPGRPFSDIRKLPFSLDRYEQFIPIWQELAGTQTLPRQSYMLLDRNAAMLKNGSTLEGGDLWADMSCFDAHVPSPAVPLDVARKGKMLFLPPVESYEKATLEGLVDYVKGGGHLVMYANSGRKSPDLPGEDWLLLRRLGLQPPTGGQIGTLDATPKNREVFSQEAGPFKLRDAWTFSPQENANVLATFKGDQPALTRHALGQGFVDVIWASTAQPPTTGGGYPFVRDLARSAGVETFSDADIPSLWTNLLKRTDSGDYYGTVYHAGWSNWNRPPVSGNTLWKVPAGKYEITELITGKTVGTMSAEDLVSKGVPTTLKPRAVAVYRFARK